MGNILSETVGAILTVLGWDGTGFRSFRLDADGHLQVDVLSVIPGAHADTHEDGGADEIVVGGLSGLLADGQTPLGHHLTHENGGADEVNVGGLSGVLADRQDADHLQGRDVRDAVPAEDDVLTWDDVNSRWQPEAAAGGAGGLYDAYVCVRDQKAQGTGSGEFAKNAWRTRTLNDEQADADGICALAGNRITLAAGTYRCMISCPAYNVESHKTRLYNVTGAVKLLDGTSEYAKNGSFVHNRSFIVGRFTVAAGQALEVQHYCTVTVDYDGFGMMSDIDVEIFTVAEFWRES